MSGTLSSISAWNTTGRWDLSEAYFLDMSRVPGADIKLSDNAVWNVGVGIAATETGNQLVYKTRIGILFGGKHH